MGARNMSTATDDPMLDHLRNRERELGQVIDDATARREEVRDIMRSLEDGRTRVRRKLKEVTLVVPGPCASEPTILPTDPPTAA